MPSDPACDAVLTAYAESLIRFKARQLSQKAGYSRSDEQDIAQELTLCLLARAHHFDPSRASVSTFANRVIKSAIAMMLRDRGRQKRAAGFTAQSLEATHVERGGETASLREALVDADLRRRTGADDDTGRRAETVAAVMEAFRSLPPDLQKVCLRLIDGTPASLAREMGVSRRQVRNAIKRIRWHFEQAGLGDT